MKTPNECSIYNDCEAPLCPLSEELNDCVWYADEEVCNSRVSTKLHWVRIQKRIRKYKIKVDAGYFTREMLNSIRNVSKGIKGMDPDSRASLSVWLNRRTPQDTTQDTRISSKSRYLSFEENYNPPKQENHTQAKQLSLV